MHQAGLEPSYPTKQADADPPRLGPRTLQPVVSRYIDWANPAPRDALCSTFEYKHRCITKLLTLHPQRTSGNARHTYVTEKNTKSHRCVMNQPDMSMHLVRLTLSLCLHVFFIPSFVRDRLGHRCQYADTKLQLREVTFLSNVYKTTEWQVYVSHFESSHDFHSVSFHTWNRTEKCSILKHNHCFTVTSDTGSCTICQSLNFSASLESWFVFVSQLVCQSYYINLSRVAKVVADLLLPF
jgi:hypothetical protein